MLEFSNGYRLTFACGSGALGFDGRGWIWEWPLRWIGFLNPKDFTVVAKTLTLNPTTGNLSLWHPWTCVKYLRKRNRQGFVNAVGLSNPGLQSWLTQDYPRAKKLGYSVAASVAPENPEESATMGRWLKNCKLGYIEVNPFCPNREQNRYSLPELLKPLLIAKIPLVLKLSADQINSDLLEVNEFVEAYHAINTIPWKRIFPGRSPLTKYAHQQAGGVSGDFIRRHALEAVWRLQRWTDRPIIGGGGISSLDHVLEFENAGAKAFSIGSCFLLSPWKPNRIVSQYRARKKYSSLC